MHPEFCFAVLGRGVNHYPQAGFSFANLLVYLNQPDEVLRLAKVRAHLRYPRHQWFREV